MVKILLIGCGQLGIRYLQGFFNSHHEIMIQIIDPSKLSKSNVDNLLSTNIDKTNKKYFFIDSIEEVCNDISFAVIATSSNIRYKILEELVSKTQIKKIILEKVLFQKEQEYFKALKLIKDNDIQCWVNHTRRMFPFYKKIREYLKNSKYFSFSVSGGSWGIACNALHFLDCIEFLSQSKISLIDFSNLNKVLYPSKREGFLELNGLIAGKTNNVLFSLNSMENYSPVLINICSDDMHIIIDESKNFYYIKGKSNNWDKFEYFEEKICYFQSELSAILLEDILNNSCQLPEYEEAMELHLKFITPLIEYINTFSENKYDYCPIT
ncbi:dehydrogenase [Campylobacter coli]|nr:dehydrogenase [Campylobacter coli]EAK1359522.1 dehydrogenase [Campylobacter coli]EGK8203494.1 Gfo/Idh/MocA family oxidoreductase [Campylobacter coli]